MLSNLNPLLSKEMRVEIYKTGTFRLCTRVKLGLSHYVKNIDIGCSKIGCFRRK